MACLWVGACRAQFRQTTTGIENAVQDHWQREQKVKVVVELPVRSPTGARVQALSDASLIVADHAGLHWSRESHNPYERNANCGEEP